MQIEKGDFVEVIASGSKGQVCRVEPEEKVVVIGFVRYKESEVKLVEKRKDFYNQ